MLGRRGYDNPSTEEWFDLVSHLKLPRRQHQILRHILEGLTDKEIAAELQVAQPTARTHLQRLFERLCVRDRTALVIDVFRRFRRFVDGK